MFNDVANVVRCSFREIDALLMNYKNMVVILTLHPPHDFQSHFLVAERTFTLIHMKTRIRQCAISPEKSTSPTSA